MWERGLFTELVETRTSSDGSDLGAQLASLFTVIDTPENRRARSTDELFARFPYANGGLFAERIDTPFFSKEARQQLLACCAFDWSGISPAIFGSLFQSVKDKDARRELGEHYTSETNILKLIRPLFLDELFERYDAAQHSIQMLNTLRNDIRKLSFLDPACGCGNFLVISYRELRRLDLEIQKRLRVLTGSQQNTLDVTLDLAISLNQFYGIEIEEWPARIAETALFLVDQQMNIELAQEFGEAPDRLPIDETTTAKINIVNALHIQWSALLPPTKDTIVLGNPPFVGISLRTSEQTQDLKAVFGSTYHGSLDLVTAWYIKAIEYYGNLPGRWAFVSTNSICQGEPVAPLWRPILSAGWRVRFAHRSFVWDSEAPNKAAVHVSIIGFDRRTAPKPVLYRYPKGNRGESQSREVTRINAYLIDAPLVIVEGQTNPLSPSVPEVSYGNKPTDGRNFQVSVDDYAQFASDPYAAKYLRRYIGAKELLHDLPRWCLWLVDPNPADLTKSQLLKSRVEAVRDFRSKSEAATTREASSTPALFRQISQPATYYLAIPIHVSENRSYFPAAYYPPSVISSNANFVVADPTGFAFGLISSSMFIAWQKAIGGRIKSDLRFNKFLTWNTFPIPEVTQKNRKAIEKAAKYLIDTRKHYKGIALADLYNPLAMPADVVKAHRQLDHFVDKAFGTSARMGAIEDRQRILFRSYARLTDQEKLL